MTNRKQVVDKVQTDPFKLELPPELAQIQPLHVIALPGKHIGLIFEETLTPDGKVREGRHYSKASSNDELNPRKGWRYMVRKADGSPASERSGVGHWAGAFYDNPLDLKLAIEYDAQVLVPKTRTRRERDDYED